jgi:hypothetical protein
MKKRYLTHTAIVGYPLQLLFYGGFCKLHSLVRRDFLASGGQVSISPTFYEQLLRQNPFAKKLETQIVST